MSREIKFDFVYKGDFQFHHKKYYLDELIDNTLASLSDVHSQMALIAKRQYIGHKDKNGKEIYEGDILSCPDLGDDYPLIEVRFGDCYKYDGDNGCNGWYGLYIGTDKICHINSSCEITVKIIGNIYENPELLP